MVCYNSYTSAKVFFKNLGPFSGRIFNCLYALSAKVLYIVLLQRQMKRLIRGRPGPQFIFGDKIISVKREVPS